MPQNGLKYGNIQYTHLCSGAVFYEKIEIYVPVNTCMTGTYHIYIRIIRPYVYTHRSSSEVKDFKADTARSMRRTQAVDIGHQSLPNTWKLFVLPLPLLWRFDLASDKFQDTIHSEWSWQDQQYASNTPYTVHPIGLAGDHDDCV